MTNGTGICGCCTSPASQTSSMSGCMTNRPRKSASEEKCIITLSAVALPLFPVDLISECIMYTSRISRKHFYLAPASQIPAYIKEISLPVLSLSVFNMC